jgi:ribonucleoside-diphosphate reductase alpha chain
MKVVKRTGEIVDFDITRISNAISKAIHSTNGAPPEAAEQLAKDIALEIEGRFVDFYPNVENIQDIVEKHLMKNGYFEVAKHYILYRSQRAKVREVEKKKDLERLLLGRLKVQKADGRTVLFDLQKVRNSLTRAMRGHESASMELLLKEIVKNVYDGIKTGEIQRILVLSATSLIEKDPVYSKVAARLFMQKLFKEVIGRSLSYDMQEIAYREAFIWGIKKGVAEKVFDSKLLEFDLVKLSKQLKLERDELFEYMGLQTLYERYLAKAKQQRIELPQVFWMRVAMGLAVEEENKNEKALEFYEVLSTLRFVSSTPTLFHSGTSHPQLSSCYLTTVEDDLAHIFKCLGDNAQLSKWSGGLGNDWSNIRATGAWIGSTKVESQGVIPFLKIANDVTMAINRSGKRRGATCAYLETWHADIEDFLDLRKNTGDERRRTHDMNTANWIPDLFMKRVMENGKWSLFSPEEVPELHHMYGRKFEEKYEEYERMAAAGKIKLFRVVEAQKLWRKMLSMLFETGHPWMTFKDPCNIRSPQDHVGVVHSSNLCTEITLNTSKDETAVCNLGSVNLERHVFDGELDLELLASTVKTAIRMLDNVIDINYYPTPEAENSNLRHRPIGLGLMGVQDAFYKLGMVFDSEGAVDFTDRMMEAISYYAILASSELAKEKGPYETYKGSKWERGIFPLDTLKLLEEERGVQIDVDRKQRLDWSKVKAHVEKHGMRNSNTMAIAPTATISTISGCLPCVEPIYKNIYVKSNISGEFTVVNHYLVEDLKKAGLWSQDMLDQIKYYDGNIQNITSIPDGLKALYKEAFEIDPSWILKHAAARAKWLDQSQSVNIFMSGTSGKVLNSIYIDAWRKGLKTTYYLRTLAASQIEKSTLDASKFGFTQKRQYELLQTEENPATQKPIEPKLTIVSGGETCEACQ